MYTSVRNLVFAATALALGASTLPGFAKGIGNGIPRPDGIVAKGIGNGIPRPDGIVAKGIGNGIPRPDSV